LSYLPKATPEHTVLMTLDPSQEHAGKTSTEAKDAFRECLTQGLDVVLSSDEIIGLAKVAVAKIPQDDPDVVAIREILRAWLRA